LDWGGPVYIVYWTGTGLVYIVYWTRRSNIYRILDWGGPVYIVWTYMSPSKSQF